MQFSNLSNCVVVRTQPIKSHHNQKSDQSKKRPIKKATTQKSDQSKKRPLKSNLLSRTVKNKTKKTLYITSSSIKLKTNLILFYYRIFCIPSNKMLTNLLYLVLVLIATKNVIATSSFAFY